MKRITALLITVIAISYSALAFGQTPTEIAEGAKAWAQNCTRCHNARSPLERNDRDWATIAAHMRTRANLTRTETKRIIVYLQMMNGNDAQGTAQASEESSRGKNSDSKGSKNKDNRGDVRRLALSSLHR